MLRVLTLGGLTLDCSGESLMVAHPRLQGLGVLARLAAAGDRGVSREKLIGCFWPEKNERAALHSLSQALHRIRSELGGTDFFIGRRILRLDSRRVASDVGDFEQAFRAREMQRAVELYRGPFLDGIYFNGIPEAERWVEGERARLAALHASALRELAASATAKGNHDDASRWWELLLSHNPLDGRVATELVRSLAAGGDEANALREARHYQDLVRSELRSEPDARVRAFIERHEAHR